ncbi:hypothetical protein ANO14919_098130 [Xylariales sp. No.14919]|nr:hypothetical protein ANO14919_098130 [Xylariales sp. No.14919]
MTDDGLVGWVSTPNVRGTLSIIYSRATVIITAIWTILHLDVPGKADGLMQTLSRKVRWGIFAIFAPDLLTLVAASQWVSARKSVEQMEKISDVGYWTSVHAFYANSGAEKRISVSRECRTYLLSSIARLHTIAKDHSERNMGQEQSGLDVQTPTILHCEFSMSKILIDCGIPPNASYADSPLDFILGSDKVWERRPSFKRYDLERQMEADSRNRARLQRIPNDAILTKRLPLNVLAALVIPPLDSLHRTSTRLEFCLPIDY